MQYLNQLMHIQLQLIQLLFRMLPKELAADVFVEMDEDKEKALNVALNKINGDWDKDKLALLITDLQGSDFDVSLTGFDAAEIDDLFKDALKDDVEDDNFDVEAELQKPPVSKPGDLWLLGNHRLLCGDSTDEKNYEILMDGKKANLVVTDPPYNVNYGGDAHSPAAGKHRVIENDNMTESEFYKFLLAFYQNAEKALRPRRVILHLARGQRKQQLQKCAA